MDHLARKTSISLTTRPKALKDVSITNTFTISLSSGSMQACKAKESLLQVEDEASPPRPPSIILPKLLNSCCLANFATLMATDCQSITTTPAT